MFKEIPGLKFESRKHFEPPSVYFFFFCPRGEASTSLFQIMTFYLYFALEWAIIKVLGFFFHKRMYKYNLNQILM